jgi:hypothetical protein
LSPAETSHKITYELQVEVEVPVDDVLPVACSRIDMAL